MARALTIRRAGRAGGRQRYQLTQNFAFVVRDSGVMVRVVVPAGTVTDFASIPRPLWWLYPPDGPWAEAAVIHDWLYSRGLLSRFLSDAIFREAMARYGVPWWRRAILYYAVRLFGGRHYGGEGWRLEAGDRRERES